MNVTMFNTLLAVTTKVKTPIDGSIGVWLKYGSSVISSGMTITYTTTIGSGREADRVYVYRHGVLSSANIGYWGNMYVSNGGVAISPTTLQNGANIVVSRGGLVTNPTLRGGHLYLRNGLARDAVVSGGEIQVYYSGTLLSGAVVLSAGTVTVSSGSAFNCVFYTRAITAPIYLYGGKMVTCTFSSGTVLRISGGGTAASCTVNGKNAAGGNARIIVFSGLATATTISSGGRVTVNQAGARGSGNRVLFSGLLDVSSGGIDAGATVCSGGALTVSLGGSALDVTVSGANAVLTATSAYLGGVRFADKAVPRFSAVTGSNIDFGNASSATAVISAACQLNGLTVGSGGVVRTDNTHNIISGAVLSGRLDINGSTTATDVAVCRGGMFAGNGIASNVTVSSGGFLRRTGGTEPGGALYNVSALAGGSLRFDATTTPFTVSGLLLDGSITFPAGPISGNLYLNDVIVKVPTYVYFQPVYMAGLTIYSGHTIVRSQATTASTTVLNVVLSGGTLTLSNGVVASDVVVNSRCLLAVSSGASALYTTIESGGTQTVYNGGVAQSCTISSGGFQCVSSGGVAEDCDVSHFQYVSSGGTAIGTIAHYRQYVSAGGSVMQTVVKEPPSGVNAALSLPASTWASGVIVSSNGTAWIQNTEAFDFTISSGGYAQVYPGAMVSGVVVESGGRLLVQSGASALTVTSLAGATVTVRDGGYIEYV